LFASVGALGFGALGGRARIDSSSTADGAGVPSHFVSGNVAESVPVVTMTAGLVQSGLRVSTASGFAIRALRRGLTGVAAGAGFAGVSIDIDIDTGLGAGAAAGLAGAGGDTCLAGAGGDTCLAVAGACLAGTCLVAGGCRGEGWLSGAAWESVGTSDERARTTMAGKRGSMAEASV
jgi:hypothetical protein